ncbi:MAG: hypothetical protein NTW08_02270 [Gammaproteobacteria bacterium]|nr:hypothetical protein [Gammaproteobacteria bacterium]
MYPYLLSFLLFFTTATFAHPTAEPLQLDIFLTSTCPHCIEAHEFFTTYTKQHPDISVHYHWINTDRDALKDMHARLLKEKKIDFSVPAFFFCNAHWSGFSTVVQQELIQNLNTCQKQLNQHRSPTLIQHALQDKTELMRYFNQSYAVIPSFLFMPFTAIMLLLNPCSLFFFITFLIFMYLSEQAYFSLKMGITSLMGLTCALLIHLIDPIWYYALIQSNWLRVFALVPALSLIPYIYTHIRRHPEQTARHPERSEGSPSNAKRSLAALGMTWTQRMTFAISPSYLLLTSFITSFSIYFFQQTCPLNLAQLFHIWLNITPTHASIHLLFIMTYLVIYLLIPTAIVFICYHQKKRAAYKPPMPYRLMHTVSLLFLGFMSLILIIQPSILSSFGLSLVTLGVSILIGWGITKRQNRSKP